MDGFSRSPRDAVHLSPQAAHCTGSAASGLRSTREKGEPLIHGLMPRRVDAQTWSTCTCQSTVHVVAPPCVGGSGWSARGGGPVPHMIGASYTEPEPHALRVSGYPSASRTLLVVCALTTV